MIMTTNTNYSATQMTTQPTLVTSPNNLDASQPNQRRSMMHEERIKQLQDQFNYQQKGIFNVKFTTRPSTGYQYRSRRNINISSQQSNDRKGFKMGT